MFHVSGIIEIHNGDSFDDTDNDDDDDDDDDEVFEPQQKRNKEKQC